MLSAFAKSYLPCLKRIYPSEGKEEAQIHIFETLQLVTFVLQEEKMT